MHDKQQIRNNRIDHIYKLVESTSRSLDKVKDMLKNLDRDDQRKNYHDVDGVTGIFDGVAMVTPVGQKYDVPANYAAKSRLVEGDTLKMIEENGSKVFKQTEKVERKKVEGIMTKKEGKWHIISDSGTFRVSDVAAEFQHAELYDEASGFIPAKGSAVTFAALDTIKKKMSAKDATAVTLPVYAVPKSAATTVVEHKSSPTSSARPLVRPAPSRPATTLRPRLGSARHANTTKPVLARNAKPAAASFVRPAPKVQPKEPSKEFVNGITPQDTRLDDDDLR